MRAKWRSALPAVLGALLLIVPAAYILNKSHSIFAEECRQQCDVKDMDYKVRAADRRTSDPLEYPGQCICVGRAEKRWWEIWK